MSGIIFDHAHKQCSLKNYLALEKHGLLIDPKLMTEHPPKDVCRFTYLKNGYLEFIEDRTFGGPLKRFSGSIKPGLCLALENDEDLEKFAQNENLKQFEAYITRRAYDWKNGNTGAGWTFLMFRKPIFSGLNLWFIRYDKVESSRTKREKNNAFVSKITLLYRQESDVSNFEALTGVSATKGVIHMDNIDFKFRKWEAQKPTAIESITIKSSAHTQSLEIPDRAYWDLNIIPA
jgi:hypothetical protein